MTRFTKLPSQALAIGLFAVTGLAAAGPMADFVDCSDSFWAVACSANLEAEPAIVPGEPIQIDNDPICMPTDDGYIICHT